MADGFEHDIILSVNRAAATLFVDGVPFTQSIGASIDDCATSDDEPCTLHVGQRVSLKSKYHTHGMCYP